MADLTKSTAGLSYREWDLLRNAWQDSDDYDPTYEPHKLLLAKLDWYCADTYDIPDTDDRPKPASNE